MHIFAIKINHNGVAIIITVNTSRITCYSLPKVSAWVAAVASEVPWVSISVIRSVPIPIPSSRRIVNVM